MGRFLRARYIPTVGIIKIRLKKEGVVFLHVLPILSLLGLAAVALPTAHRAALRHEKKLLTPPGRLVEINGHTLHVYTEGGGPGPTLVFLSGSGTPAPVYDFKSLYSLLSPKHKIAVVEKFGYGYSSAVLAKRDVDSLLSDTRRALQVAGLSPPYVLIPHSFSGLDALRWASLYPEELTAIIGLDMGNTEVYRNFKVPGWLVSVLEAAGWLGVQRLLPSSQSPALAKAERRQERLLSNRNFYNSSVIAEGRTLRESVRRVADGEKPHLPMLLFVSNGKGTGIPWRPAQQQFASQVGAQLVFLDCGHYLHVFEPERIASGIEHFLTQTTPLTDPSNTNMTYKGAEK